MKLSDIVDYYNFISALDIKIECAETTRRLEAISHVIENHPIRLKNYTKEVTDYLDGMNNQFNQFSELLHRLKQELKQIILEQEPSYLQTSQRIFDHEMVQEDYNHVLNRHLVIDDHSNIKLRSKLRNLSDWHLPGLIFRPALENFVEDMVPLDPLYLVDEHQDLLTPAVKKFTYEYQQRLRRYVINDRQPDTILGQLPDSQFGVVFAYNYFNFKPLDVLYRYLREIAIKLRPGGTLIMTYNNCDRAHGIALAERGWMLYQPKRLIELYLEKVGLELVEAHDGLGDLSWLEIRKPGNISSLRGGQTLAKIVAITN